MYSIVVLNKNNELAAILFIQDGLIFCEYFDYAIEAHLNSTLVDIQKRKLSVLKELHDKDGGVYVIQKTISIADPEYLPTVAKELESRGFTIGVVDVRFAEKIRENREEWKKFLETKAVEILADKTS